MVSSSQSSQGYDVFISYRWVEPDMSWVRDQLYPALEAAGLEVCLDIADFVPGRDLILEMARAGQESRRALCVLSDAYFDGERSVHFESLMARRFDPTGSRSELIPLILRPTIVPEWLRGLIPVDWTDPKRRKREWHKLLSVLGASRQDVSPPGAPRGDSVDRESSRRRTSPSGEALPQDQERKILFQAGGTLPLDAPSYITRACDKELKLQLERYPLIALAGDYQTGKSSLLRRLAGILPSDFRCCLIDFQGLRTDNVQSFVERFLKEVEEEIGSVQDWTDLIRRLKHQSLALGLDEFGAMGHPLVVDLVPKLHKLATESAARIRIVVCLHGPIETYIADHLQNSKYWSDWKTISLRPFTKLEARELLALLPGEFADATKDEFGKIYRLSRGHPRRLQKVCKHLSEMPPGQTAEEARRVLLDPSSYE